MNKSSSADVAKLLAETHGWKLRDCGGDKGRTLSGYYTVTTPDQALASLKAAGADASLTGSTLNLGCSSSPPAPGKPAAAPVAYAEGERPGQTGTLSDGRPVVLGDRSFVPPREAAPDPDMEEVATRFYTNFLPGKAFDDIVRKLPGLSVLADPDRPGPMIVMGPKKWVGQARAFIRELDACPVEVRITAAVVARSGSALASRAFGVRLDAFGGDLVAGATPPIGGGVGIQLGPLQAVITGLRDRYRLEEVYSSQSRVLLGRALVLNDGAEVPVSTGEVLNANGAATAISYRNVGHSLTVLPLAHASGYVVGTIRHELSAQQGNNGVGPTFGSRRVETSFRVRPGEPVVMALSGLDTTSQSKTSGVFFSGKRNNQTEAGGFLVLTLEPEGCAAQAATKERGAARPGGDLQ